MDHRHSATIRVTLEGKAVEVPRVHVSKLHRALGWSTPLSYPSAYLNHPLDQWKMEIHDFPILSYLFRGFRPCRHLEFGTWQGKGVLCCLEACRATVWTINPPFGERKADGTPAYGHHREELEALHRWAERMGWPRRERYATDTLGFIGWRYLERGWGHRVCQIYCDSRNWDVRNYPEGFFDSVLIDGGHSPDVVQNDTHKALPLLRSGGPILWHDFCPPVFRHFEATRGVMEGIVDLWERLRSQTRMLFWIEPSWLLLGVKK